MNPSMMLYRIGNWFHRYRLRKIGWMITWLNRFLFGGFVPSSAEIGKSVVIGYWGLGVVLHKNCIIGNGCHIGQNVTIGRNPGDLGVPKLGRNVYVAAGAIISGEIEIGDNVIVGANSVVLSDIPSNSLVVGAPAKIVRSVSTEELAKFHAK